jgi:hypothetical protein
MLYKVKLPIILNIIGHQAYWFIGKIHMRLAAGGAPVAIKRRAMNQSTKFKNSVCVCVCMYVYMYIYIYKTKIILNRFTLCNIITERVQVVNIAVTLCKHNRQDCYITENNWTLHKTVNKCRWFTNRYTELTFWGRWCQIICLPFRQTFMQSHSFSTAWPTQVCSMLLNPQGVHSFVFPVKLTQNSAYTVSMRRNKADPRLGSTYVA